ncbi:Protein CBG13538 [Caenorhabditis briggsae]|uniref:Protein CBG13538 n=3 Tax=Caenorhabditis TaxID=6237 RepID=A8XI48_CAEBR|nr:Protein CBG13538 [Caenorhabditis briggsae]CAP32322.1 Protein CBG13538 [Caenorhabditis briggsae]
MIRLTLLTSFLYLLINKISGELENSEVANQNTYSFIFTPIWILLFLWCAQICRATSS